MNYLKEELRKPTDVLDDQHPHFSWQLGMYAILVALAIYYLCVA
jgi:hypothetical protein